MTDLTRRYVRIALRVVFGLSLTTSVLTLFLDGPAILGVPTALVAVAVGGLLNNDYPWRKK